jgi:hypothetical protein
MAADERRLALIESEKQAKTYGLNRVHPRVSAAKDYMGLRTLFAAVKI